MSKDVDHIDYEIRVKKDHAEVFLVINGQIVELYFLDWLILALLDFKSRHRDILHIHTCDCRIAGCAGYHGGTHVYRIFGQIVWSSFEEKEPWSTLVFDELQYSTTMRRLLNDMIFLESRDIFTAELKDPYVLGGNSILEWLHEIASDD